MSSQFKMCSAVHKPFVATNEWQEIEEGQPIPPGLHIRMNLQTGKKEAKLLEKTPKPDKNSMAVAVCPVPDSTSDTTTSKET